MKNTMICFASGLVLALICLSSPAMAQTSLSDIAQQVQSGSKQIPQGQDGPPRILTFSSPKTTPNPPGAHNRIASSQPQQVTLSGDDIAYQLNIYRTQIDEPNDVFPPADIVAFVYEAIIDTPRTERPVIFAFNGGPSSAALWLHMGAWGPKRIDSPGSPETYTPPPYDLVDNEGFLIDVADLVFIDPVGTGISRARDGEDQSAFFNTRNDAHSICTFIRNWMKSENRWGAPIYIAGESFGAVRAAGISAHRNCQDLQPNLEGLIMVSGLLDLTSHNGPALGNAQIARIPTNAALAWYHGLIDRSEWNNDFDLFIREAEEVAITRYGLATLKGTSLTTVDRIAVRSDIGKYLGVTADDIADNPDQSILSLGFQKLRSHISAIPALNDGRYGLTSLARGRSPLPPLDYTELAKVFTKHFFAHTDTLTGFTVPSDYIPLSRQTSWAMRFTLDNRSSHGTNMARELARFSRPTSSGFRILIASGYHDSITPYFAMQLALQQAGFPPDRYDVKLYEGGHMMWLDRATGLQLANDVRSFIKHQQAKRPARKALDPL